MYTVQYISSYWNFDGRIPYLFEMSQYQKCVYQETAINENELKLMKPQHGDLKVTKFEIKVGFFLRFRACFKYFKFSFN